MTKLSHTLGIKVFACFLVILSALTAALSLTGVYYATKYHFYSGQATPYHKTQQCERITYDYAEELISEINYGAWNYGEQEAFAAENTSFRYVLSIKDSVHLLDNLVGEETIVPVGKYQFSLQSGNNYFADEDFSEITNGSGNLDVIVEAYITEPPTVADNYWNSFWLHQTLYDIHSVLLPIAAVSLLILAAAFIYLLCAAGHQAGKEEIIPNLQDKVPLDLYLAIVVGMGMSIIFIGLNANPVDHMQEVTVALISIFLLSILGLATVLTCATRIKLGRYFYQNTLCYRILRLCGKIFSYFLDGLKAISAKWKVALIWLILSSVYFEGGLGALLLNIVLTFVLCTIVSQLERLKNGGEELVKGNLNHKIDTHRMFPLFRKHGENLNSISKGFSIALDQKMKSERLKTELITNVSHDIKTPLTSIINYVDLLKKEGLEGQAAEYIEVLDRQSRRLKKLTEDLVEASKASTGNLKVHLAPTDMGELVAQAIAEYEEKLEKAQLEVVVNGGETPVFALVDGNLTWRVLSNLLSNACKYSQPNTRVYIDLKQNGDWISLSMKNISRDALNIPADDLMERFVRGDSSRHTEGSGLGLNIAQSLVGLQKGKFSLEIEGDLFKAFVTFPVAEPPAEEPEEQKNDTQ